MILGQQKKGVKTVVATPANQSATGPQIGPTEQKFAQQADRLAKLEAAVQDIQTCQTAHTDGLTQLKQENKERDQAIRAHMDETFKAIKTDLNQSFAQAIQQQ